MSDYDSPWKEALDVYFEPFMEFCFPEIHAQIDWSYGYVSLEKELYKVAPDADVGPRVVDKLVSVLKRDGHEEWVLVHVEVQSQWETRFARRIYVYNYRLMDMYNKAAVSLAVLGDDRPEWRPDRYQQGLWGCSVDFRFPIAKLLDWSDREADLAQSRNPFARFVLAHLKALATRRDAEERFRWKVQLIRGLFEAGMKRSDVHELLKFIDWLMELPQELARACREAVHQLQEEKNMPFVTSFERLAIEEGIEKGREVGREEGLKRGIRTAMTIKFQDRAAAILREIESVEDAAVLERILDAIPTADSAEDLRKIWE